MSCVAANNHLDFAKWAHENGCPWDDDVLYFAARNDNVEFAKWAFENGCPYNKLEVIDIAKHLGHTGFVKWINTL